MMTVSPDELRREFERFRDMALIEPVSIVEEGRAGLVVLSVAEFERLSALDQRTAYYVWDLPDHLKQALETSEPPGFTAQFDHELDNESA